MRSEARASTSASLRLDASVTWRRDGVRAAWAAPPCLFLCTRRTPNPLLSIDPPCSIFSGAQLVEQGEATVNSAWQKRQTMLVRHATSNPRLSGNDGALNLHFSPSACNAPLHLLGARLLPASH